MNTYKQSNQNEDLRLIAPRLAALPKYSIEETFSIPAGYFEKMHEAVLNHPFVKIAPDFVVPGLYFETLPDTIAQHAFVAKQSPFIVPENYFEQVAVKVEQKAGIRAIKSNMEVPEGYFENLPIRIQDKLYKESKTTKVFWLPETPQYRLVLVAAAVTIILVMVFFVNLFENQSGTKPQLAMNKTVQASNVVADDFQDYDETMLIEAIDQPQQIDIASNNDEQNTKTAITEYLIENDITLEDITAEI